MTKVIKEHEDLLHEVQKKQSRIFKAKNGRFIMKSKCPDCGIKKSEFVKQQEAKRFLSNLGIKTPLNKCFILRCIKMTEIVKVFIDW